MRIEVLDEPAAPAAERLAAASRPGANVVLTGGSTPRAAYGLLVAMGVDFEGVELWFTDERCVPPDHQHSNYRMAREALLDRVRGADAVHRMEGERGPDAAAAAYADELAARFGGEGAPVMDLVLLGLGPDAHTCSLFPGDAALGERERPVVGVEVPGMAPLVPRVTLTLPVLEAARELVFLVTGADKAGAVARAFSDAADPSAPGSLVRPERGELLVLLDPPAATLL